MEMAGTCLMVLWREREGVCMRLAGMIGLEGMVRLEGIIVGMT